MPGPGEYIAQQNSKNRYHGIEHYDAQHQSRDTEANADKMEHPSACA
jgi:hypothetical protein